MPIESNPKPGAGVRRDVLFIFVLFLTAFALFLPTFIFGIPDSYDLHQHFQFAATYAESIRSGVLIPDWGAWENSGLGGIGIRLYPPLAHYFLAGIQLIVGDWFVSAAVSFVLWTFIGGLGMYLFGREFMKPGGSLAVALIFMCSPFRLGQIYQSFFYSEYVATSVLVFCLLFVIRLCRRRTLTDALLLGISLALLVLSHIPTTIIAIAPLIIFTLLMIERGTWSETLPKLMLAAVIGIAGSSFFWIRLVTEVGMVSHTDPAYFSGHYDFHGSLFPRIFTSPETYFMRQMWGFDLIAVFVLLPLVPPLLIAVFGGSQFRHRWTDRKALAAMIVCGVFGLFMAAWPSVYIWERVEIIRWLQFPFRWLSIPVIFGAIALVWSLSRISVQRPIARRLAIYGTAMLALTVMLFNVTQIIMPSAMLSREVFEAERVSEILTKRSYECWWPIWAKADAFSDLRRVNAGGREVKIAEWGAFERTFSIGEGEVLEARVSTFYYPYWKLRINGIDAEPTVAADGTISFAVPAGAVEVSLRFEQPFTVELTRYVAASTWALTLLLIGLLALAGRRTRGFFS